MNLKDVQMRWRARRLRREFKMLKENRAHAIIPGDVCLICGLTSPDSPCIGQWVALPRDSKDIPEALLEWTRAGLLVWGPWEDVPRAYSTTLPDKSFAGVQVLFDPGRSYLKVVAPDDTSYQFGEMLNFPGAVFALYEAAWNSMEGEETWDGTYRQG